MPPSPGREQTEPMTIQATRPAARGPAAPSLRPASQARNPTGHGHRGHRRRRRSPRVLTRTGTPLPQEWRTGLPPAGSGRQGRAGLRGKHPPHPGLCGAAGPRGLPFRRPGRKAGWPAAGSVGRFRARRPVCGEVAGRAWQGPRSAVHAGTNAGHPPTVRVAPGPLTASGDQSPRTGASAHATSSPDATRSGDRSGVRDRAGPPPARPRLAPALSARSAATGGRRCRCRPTAAPGHPRRCSCWSRRAADRCCSWRSCSSRREQG